MNKPYIVKPDEKYCTWEVDITKLDKNTVVLASDGCRIIHYINGTVEKTYSPDNNGKKDSLVVNTKKVMKGGDEQVVGVNDDKEFTVVWGMGGVPYFDKKLKLETSVGMNGEFKFNVLHYPSLIGALGKMNILPQDVKEFTAAKLQETLKSKLALKLKDKKYDEVIIMQSALSNDIKYDYEEQLEKIGIKLTSFSLKEIFFPEDYIEARRSKLDNGAAEEEAEKKNRERERDEESAARIINMLKSTSDNANTEAPAAPETNLSHYCPRCGKEVAIGAKFCDRCGTKL